MSVQDADGLQMLLQKQVYAGRLLANDDGAVYKHFTVVSSENGVLTLEPEFDYLDD